MKKCYCCGAKVPDEARFCPRCGKPIEVTKVLVDRAIVGDAEAQAELYYRTYEVVYYRIREMTGDKETAEELTQDTYLRAFNHLSQLKEPAAFPSWVLTIARNLTINWYRKHGKEKETAAFSGTEDFGEGTLSPDDDVKNMPEYRIDFIPDESLDRAETVRLIQEILGSLSDNQRTVLILRFQYQMSINEIAAELELNPNTVKSRLYDGQKRVELKVKELEKQGTKLYSLAPLPFLLFLLRSAESEAPEIPAGQILEHIQHSLRADTAPEHQESPAQSDAEQTSPKQPSRHPNTGSTTGAATKAAAETAGGVMSKGLAVKAIAMLVAAGLICGSGTAVYTQTRRNADDAAQEAVSSAPVEVEPTDEQALADADVEELLESFASWYAWGWYEDVSLDLTASMAVEIAAEAFAQSCDDYYERMDFDGYQLDTDGIEEYLYDLFGTQYTIEDFEVSPTYLIEQRSDGQFYYLGYTDGYLDASVRVVSISDAANEDGTYTVRARYVQNSSYDEYYILYVDYQLTPDESAKYGCIITGMSAVEPEDTTDINDGNDSDNDVEEWAELYADYLESGNLDVSGYGYFCLIYLNDDNTPELLYLGGSNVDGEHILYIQDGQVKSQRMEDISVYAKRGGYIAGCGGSTGACIEELHYLDEDGVLTEVFWGGSYAETSWQYDVMTGVRGNRDYNATLYTEDESTIVEGEEEYFAARDTVFSWASDGAHTVITTGDDGLFDDPIESDTGAALEEIIEYLRTGTTDNWEDIYLDHLDDYDADNDTYALIYLDNDDDPVFVCYDTREDYAVLLLMQDGQVTSQTVSYDPDDEEWLWLDDAVEYTTAYIEMDEWLEID